MKRAQLKIRWLVIGLVLAASAGAADAQPPDILRHYRFLPFHSTLSFEGGFAGFDIDANIRGTFDFATGFREEFPNLEQYAQFLNVDAEAINPTDFGPYSWDLDQTQNLSGLDGEYGLRHVPLVNWLFTGLDGQRAPIRIRVVEFGRWLVMFGKNAPPPNTADLFEYELRAIARQAPFADFNHDDAVDRHDLHAWARGFGASLSDAMAGGEFLMWQQQIGETPPDLDLLEAQINAAPSTAAIPEPTGAALLACGLLAMFRGRSVRPELT